MTEEERKKDDPPAIIRKRDGAFTYTTSDLATIKYRVDTFKPDAMVYVVDFRQALHFRTFFAQARRWGYNAVELEHVSFGSVLGKDGKPLKTREGTASELLPLLDDAIELGLEKYRESYAQRKEFGHDVPELSDSVIHDIAEAVGSGAIKYADLSQNRNSDYKYDPEKMLSTDGNSATYMQFAYARCRAILRKGQIDEAKLRAASPNIVITHLAERAICLQLMRFEESLIAAADEYLPHYITGHLWELAKSISVFYENCPVLTAETPELRNSRLLLVDLCGRVIRQALDLLGIRTVERM
jgi:arginyl-tRNA synthetase